MLENHKSLKSALLFFAAACVSLTIFLFAETWSSSFEGCIDKEAANNSQQTTKENNRSISVVFWIEIRGRCTAGFIRSHNGEITALATLLIAAFTFTLWWASAGTYDLLEKQIALARDEFNATHRPHIRIHSVKYEPIVHEDGDSDFDKIGARVIFYNTGESTALIEAIEYSIKQRVTPLDSGILLIDAIQPRHKAIESGRGDYIELASDIEPRITRQSSDVRSRVILLGKIFYRDQMGGLRQTGFCRAWGGTPLRRAWEPIDDPEYEYSY